MFYDNFVKMCVLVDKKPSAVALDIGINKSTVSNWKNRGTMPTDAIAQKIADYFGITVKELMTDNENKPTQEGELTETQREAWELIMKIPEDKLKVLIASLKATMGE